MLSEMAKNDLMRLREQGYSITDEEVVALNDLAIQLERGKDTTAINHPRIAYAGNVVLHEPTIGALEWWWQFGHDAAWTSNGKLNTYYFMLAHARDLDTLLPLQKPSDINKAVRIWLRGVGATSGELFRALLYVKNGYGDYDAVSGKNYDSSEALDQMWKVLLMCAGTMGVSVDDLKTHTQTELVNLLHHASNGKMDLKPSVAEKYIRYQELVRKIESRGVKENG